MRRFYTLSEIVARKANFSETHISMIFWPVISYLLSCGLYLAIRPISIHMEAIPYMAANGLTWVFGWWLLIKALKQTIVGDLAPFQFLLLPYGLMLDAFLWKQNPGSNLLTGSVIIIGSVLFLIILKKRSGSANIILIGGGHCG